MGGICSIAECTDIVLAKGLCSKHWKRARKGQDPTVPSRYEMTDEQRFWSKVERRGPDECWNWKAGTAGRGKVIYGKAWFRGKGQSAHKVAWILTHGPIQQVRGLGSHGLCVLHGCDNPLCVNPRHLSLGTHQANMDDKVIRNRTNRHKPFCKNGHPRTPENLYTSKTGLRACRECHRLREKQRKRRARGNEEQRTFSF